LKPEFVTLLAVPTVKPAGGVKFAEPSDCCALGSFVRVSVNEPGVFNVRWTFATYGFVLAACAEPIRATAAAVPASATRPPPRLSPLPQPVEGRLARILTPFPYRSKLAGPHRRLPPKSPS
jgi:hypothetical protein